MELLLTLPDLDQLAMAWPELRDRISEYNRLAGEHRAASAALEALLASRPAAIEADRLAYAAALRLGKDDPGTTALAKLNARITTASRKAEALAAAVQSTARDIAAAVEGRRAALLDDVDQALGEDRDALAHAVTAWVAARTRLDQHRALRSWIALFPQRTKWTPTVSMPVRGIDTANGEPISFPEIAQALRADAAEPAPVAEPAA